MGGRPLDAAASETVNGHLRPDSPAPGLDTGGWEMDSGLPKGRKELWQGPMAPGAGVVEAALVGLDSVQGAGSPLCWFLPTSCPPGAESSSRMEGHLGRGTTGCLPSTLGPACTMFLKLSCRDGSGEARGTSATQQLTSRQHQKTPVLLQLMGLGRSQGPGVLGGLYQAWATPNTMVELAEGLWLGAAAKLPV